jgi:hypothetical protein
MTTDRQIQIAREIAEQISKLQGVVSCKVDDWSDYGSFRAFAELQLAPYAHSSRYVEFDNKHVNLRSLSHSINTILNPVEKESVVCPKMKYYTAQGRKFKQGYEETCIQIDFRVLEGAMA